MAARAALGGYPATYRKTGGSLGLQNEPLRRRLPRRPATYKVKKLTLPRAPSLINKTRKAYKVLRFAKAATPLGLLLLAAELGYEYYQIRQDGSPITVDATGWTTFYNCLTPSHGPTAFTLALCNFTATLNPIPPEGQYRDVLIGGGPGFRRHAQFYKDMRVAFPNWQAETAANYYKDFLDPADAHGIPVDYNEIPQFNFPIDASPIPYADPYPIEVPKPVDEWYVEPSRTPRYETSRHYDPKILQDTLNIGPRSGTFSRTRTQHELRRPTKNEKEIKPKGATLGRLIVGAFTEGLDLLEALYAGLPKDIRDSSRKTNGSLNDRFGEPNSFRGKPFRSSTPQEQAQAIYDNLDEIVWEDFRDAFVENQIEDFIYGKLGKTAGKAANKAAIHGDLRIGFQSGKIL